MIKIRFLVVVTIILVTGILLQAFNIINLAALFRINEREIEVQVEAEITSSLMIPDRYVRYYLIYNGSAAESEQVPYHLEQSFRNAKIPYTACDLEDKGFLDLLRQGTPEDRYIVATAFVADMAQEAVALLGSLVDQGASLSIVTGSSSPTLYPLAGIGTGSGSTWVPTHSIHFTNGIFPLMDELELDLSDDENPFSALHLQDLHLQLEPEDADILAETDTGTPLIWRRQAGSGSVLYCNTTMFRDKVNRGLLLQLILQQGDYGLAYMQGSSMLSIDQLPGPVPAGKSEEIFPDYQRENLKFFKEIWWTDILNLRDRFDLGLTGFALGSYDTATTERSPELDLEASQAITVMGKLLSGADGELAIQGYTPSPLITADEADLIGFREPESGFWQDQEEMVSSLSVFHTLMDEIFRPVTFLTFSPTGGIYGEHTRTVAYEAFPNLRIFSGVYTGFAEPYKEHATEIELGPNYQVAGSYSIPRFSSGYENDNATLWPMLNGIAELGMLNHVIGAMDILNQDPEEFRRWNLLLTDLEDLLAPVVHAFPFLTGKTHIEAFIDYRSNEQLHCYTNRIEDIIAIQLEHVVLPVKFYFYSAKAISSVKGGLIQPVDNAGLYILEARKPDISIKLRK